MQERVRLSEMTSVVGACCSIRREPVQWTTHIDLPWNADEERELTCLAHRSRSAAALACAEGQDNKTVAHRLRAERRSASSVVSSALDRPDCWAPNRNCLRVSTPSVLRLEVDPNLANREPLLKTALESRGRTGVKREDPAHRVRCEAREIRPPFTNSIYFVIVVTGRPSAAENASGVS